MQQVFERVKLAGSHYRYTCHGGKSTIPSQLKFAVSMYWL